MRYLVLICVLFWVGLAYGQAPLSVAASTMKWSHSESSFRVEILGETIQSKLLSVSKSGVTWEGPTLTSDATELEWCLWLLFVERSLSPALKGLGEVPKVVVTGDRIGVQYHGNGQLLVDFETNHPIRLVYFQDRTEWTISWAAPGSWDNVMIYRNGAPSATVRKIPQAPKEE